MARAETAKIARAQAAYEKQAGGSLPDCAGAFIQMVDVEAGLLRIVPIRCHKWSCHFCAPIKLREARQKARAGAPQRHIVLTLRHRPDVPLPQQIEILRDAFRKLVSQIRKTFSAFEYMAVLELQKNGSPHLHILARGTYIPWKWLSRKWLKLTGAWMVHIKAIKREAGAISEIVKYLAKTAQDLQTLVPGANVLTCSRHWLLCPETQDPGHLEHNWHACFVPWSSHDYQDVLGALGAQLVPLPSAPGIYSIDCHSPPSPNVVEAAERELPSYLHELLYFACGTLRDLRQADREVRSVSEHINPFGFSDPGYAL